MIGPILNWLYQKSPEITPFDARTSSRTSSRKSVRNNQMVQKFTFGGGLVDLVDSATDLSNCLVDSLLDTEEGIKNNSELNDSGIDLSSSIVSISVPQLYLFQFLNCCYC